jgi:hypothetical protein
MEHPRAAARATDGGRSGPFREGLAQAIARFEPLPLGDEFRKASCVSPIMVRLAADRHPCRQVILASTLQRT